MTAVSTTVIPVKRAIVALLKALHSADQPPVEVIYGPLDTETVQLDRVVSVRGVQAGTSDLDALDLGSAGEVYVVEVITSVDIRTAGDEGQQAATEAVLTLYARQEALMREGHPGDLNLGAQGVLGARPSGSWDLLERVSDKGRSAAVRWGVQIIGQRQ